MKKVVSLLLLLTLAGCAHHFSGNAADDPYGFFSGVWHGLIVPFTMVLNVGIWVISLVDSHVFCNIEIIGRPNTGFYYYGGFATGIGLWSLTGQST